MPLRSYEVNVRGQNWQKTILHVTAGKAKYAYLRDVQDSWPGTTFKDLECRSLGAVMQTEDFVRVAHRRGVPYARLGMRVQMEDDYGVIVGANASANFEVLFTNGAYSGKILSCHPNFMIKYFDTTGKMVGEFRG